MPVAGSQTASATLKIICPVYSGASIARVGMKAGMVTFTYSSAAMGSVIADDPVYARSHFFLQLIRKTANPAFLVTITWYDFE